ncbi:MAG: hypothetical protein IJ432_01280 [Clostridia bacterium]|nr:hypothetical protein [Clostridia bacterium]MEE1055120.1 YerC/YecD family TrpR-related protein [Acutalibacteraceae bacterium]
MPKNQKDEVNKLFKAILTLKTQEECAAFFDDVCTIQEIEAIAQRFEVACQLSDGKSYIDINKNTGASTATICRVSKCLNYGDGGYATAIERLKEGN